MNNLEIAETIRQQIGGRALFMLGAKDLTAADGYLQFKVGRNSKSVTHIRVTLDRASDTYTVTAYRARRKKGEVVPEIKVLETCDQVYADSLHSVLESLTGMYTSL